MNVTLLDNNMKPIRSKKRIVTGTYPNQVTHSEPLTVDNLQGIVIDIFHAMYCDHMLHDHPQRGSAYHVMYEDGVTEQLAFTNPAVVSGQPADPTFKPLTYKAAV